jgi:NAD(P)H-hydrate epimerase
MTESFLLRHKKILDKCNNMNSITSSHARRIDEMAREKYRIPTSILMENAGRVVAAEIIRLKKRRIAVVCGKGNNGGDGFVCARHLLIAGKKVDVFLAGNKSRVKDDARLNLDILLNLGCKINSIDEKDLNSFKSRLGKYDLVVDAIFGVGLKGSVGGFFRGLIESINRRASFILSIDIPSGLDADSGKIRGACIRADTTVTFIAKKCGMVKADGPKYCGKITEKDIGFPIKI